MVKSGSEGICGSGGSGGMVESRISEKASGLFGISSKKFQAWSYVLKPLQKQPGKKYSVEGSQQYGWA